MEALDAELRGGLQGIPFCVNPSRIVWEDHGMSTWHELLERDAESFDEEFLALGPRSGQTAREARPFLSQRLRHSGPS